MRKVQILGWSCLGGFSLFSVPPGQGCLLSGGLFTSPRRRSGFWSRRRFFVGKCHSRPPPVLSSGAQRSRDLSTSRADTHKAAGSVEVSPLRATGALRSRRRCFVGRWHPRPPLVLSSGADATEAAGLVGGSPHRPSSSQDSALQRPQTKKNAPRGVGRSVHK